MVGKKRITFVTRLMSALTTAASYCEMLLTWHTLSFKCVFNDTTWSLRLCIARAERDGTRAETRFCLSPKWTSPFKSVGALVQSTAGIRGVRISFSNAGYTTFSGGVRVLATHSIHQFPLHFPSHASPCAIRFRTISTIRYRWTNDCGVPVEW